jgi:hypothetical protein
MRLTGLACVTGIAVAIAVAALPNASAGRAINSCRISEMRLAIGPLVSEKTEQHTATVTLTNISPTACRLDGYPTIKLFDSRGGALPFIYSHRGDQMITGARPPSIDLRSRVSAFFAFNKSVCVTLTTRFARTLHIALSTSPASHSIRLPRYPIIDYCPTSDPGATITVSPIEPSLKEAACLSQRSCRRRSG